MALCCLTVPYSASALDYANNQQLGLQLQQLASTKPALARAQSIVKSLGNEDVWLLEIGIGPEEERKDRPAFLLVAGIEGNDLAGSVSALAWAERLASGFESDDVGDFEVGGKFGSVATQTTPPRGVDEEPWTTLIFSVVSKETIMFRAEVPCT